MRNNSSNNTYNNADKGWEKKIENSYASAPYNFIPFPEKVVYRHEIEERSVRRNVKDETEIIIKELVEDGQDILHNSFKEDRKTGYIRYRIEVKTPTFIGDGDGNFFEIDGTPMIPGSTVRGKVRSTAEILSCAYPEFVRDDKLWYREMMNKGVLKNSYENFIKGNQEKNIKKVVKAGYISCIGNNQYKIMPAKKDKNGYSYRDIKEEDLRKIKEDESTKNLLQRINFMYENKSGTDLQLWNKVNELKDEKKPINKKITEFEKRINELSSEEKVELEELKKLRDKKQGEIRTILTWNKNTEFKAYFTQVAYDNNYRIKDMKRRYDSDLCGILMNSYNLDAKQNHYLIFEKDNDSRSLIIGNDIVNRFNTSVKLKQKENAYDFRLPSGRQEKPIFYVLDDDNNVASFGFTPYLKIPYKKSVCEGIKTKKGEERSKIDYVQGLFGFTNLGFEKNSISYKGRLRFSNAKLTNNIGFSEEINKSLMGPKISSFQLYLNQPNTKDNVATKIYSEDFELRGQKFYWLKDKVDRRDDYYSAMKKSKNGTANKLQFAQLRPIKENAFFEGKIYFENLSDDELGLILMAIKPFKTAKDNIGQGKPYGFGQVEFSILEVVEEDIKNRFRSFDKTANKMKNLDDEIEKFKNSFKDYMKSQGQEINFKEDRWKSFYISRKEEVDSYLEEFKYMVIGDRRYKERRLLKGMKDIICDKDVDEEDGGEVDLSKLLSKFNK